MSEVIDYDNYEMYEASSKGILDHANKTRYKHEVLEIFFLVKSRRKLK